MLWKRKNSSVVFQTWCWRGKHAPSARACLQDANAKHICGTQTPSASILFSREILPYVLTIKIWLTVRSRSMQNFGTCKKNSAAHWRLPTNFAAKQVFLIGRRLCAVAFVLQVPKSCTDLDPSLLYDLILGTYSKIVWDLGVCLDSVTSMSGWVVEWHTVPRAVWYTLKLLP